MEYRPVVPTGVVPNLQDYHAAIPDLSPPRSQGSSTGGASSLGDYAPRMYTPPTPPTPHEDEKVNTLRILSYIKSLSIQIKISVYKSPRFVSVYTMLPCPAAAVKSSENNTGVEGDFDSPCAYMLQSHFSNLFRGVGFILSDISSLVSINCV